MKTLIVQGICKDNISSYEWETFWVPCMKSVKSWADRSGFDYKLYTERLDDTFDVEAWFPEANLQQYENVFYKFQWMKDCSRPYSPYDYVFWLDSDILVWGNPFLPEEQDLFFMHMDRVMNKWAKPNMSIFGGRTFNVRQYVDWADNVFHYNCPEPALVTCFKELCKVQLIPYMTEEYFSTAYTEEHAVRLFDYKDCTFAQDWNLQRTLGSWSKDMFYHLNGVNKVAKFQRIMAYIMYVKTQNTNTLFKHIGKILE